MRQSAIRGLALVVFLVVWMVPSATAVALELPETLPTSGSGRTWTDKSEGEPEFRLGSEKSETILKCKEASAEGVEEAGKSSGPFHTHYVGCDTKIGTSEVKCTSLDHTTEPGTILVLGHWFLVFDRHVPMAFELTVAIRYVIEDVHFSCSALVLIEIEGEELCLDLKPTEKSASHAFHCNLSGPQQTEEWCKKDESGTCHEAVRPILDVFMNHAKASEGAELELDSLTTKESLFADV